MPDLAQRGMGPVAAAGEADVKTTAELDGLVVVTRRPARDADLAARLALALPDVRLRRDASGILVPATAAGALLDPLAGWTLRWDAAAAQFAANRRRVAAVRLPVRARVHEVLAEGAGVARARLASVIDPSVLDDHQALNVAAMTAADGYGLCVFDEQGTGKTVTLIYGFDALVAQDEVDFALIVAPKSMVPEWPQDFRRFMGDRYAVTVVSGDRRAKGRAIRARADVLVTNFETVVAMESELEARLRTYQGRAILVVDESFLIKNRDAMRTRALRRLREWCGRAFVLCGTPAPNAPHDLVEQFNLVDFGATFDGLAVPDDREEALALIRSAVDARGLYVRNLKHTVLPDLPSRRFNRVFVPLAPEQSRLYEAARDDLLRDLRDTSDQEFARRRTSFLARRSAMLQICSNPAGVVPAYQEVPAKLTALDELLADVVGRRHEKVVLWSFYTASIDALVARYAPLGVVRYDGTVADVAERREAVRRFQQDDATMVFVANPAAAGAGLTLHRARLAVYESMSNQAAHYLQSLDRVHRRGQERPVEYVVLLAEGTVELSEYERLTVKERVAQALLGDEVPTPLTREALLREVLGASGLVGP